MAKYSYELKKEIVTAYLNGEGGYTHLAKNMVLLISIQSGCGRIITNPSVMMPLYALKNAEVSMLTQLKKVEFHKLH